MYEEHFEMMRSNYLSQRANYIQNPSHLIDSEKKLTNLITNLLLENWNEIKRDFDEASKLFPLWANHIPKDRGRAPKGDQIPWIEVGEHSIGHKLSRLINSVSSIREIGLPFGSDDRFAVINEDICAFLFCDVKSVLSGGNDDADYIVVPPQQVSGNGVWKENAMLRNERVTAKGKRAEHPFQPALPPIISTSDGNTFPSVHIFIKPIYDIESREKKTDSWIGQPLNKIKIICVPNGLLLCENPDYLSKYPGLFYPGKDDKSKPEEKRRCRVNTKILSQIDSWRVQTINGKNLVR